MKGTNNIRPLLVLKVAQQRGGRFGTYLSRGQCSKPPWITLNILLLSRVQQMSWKNQRLEY